MFKRLKGVQNQRGMSLIEIMIVLGIIATATAAIMSAVLPKADIAKRDQTKTTMSSLKGDLQQYKMEKKKYPSNDEGLSALVEAGYIEEVPVDGWGNDFVYEYPGSHGKKYDLCSPGKDEDSDEDDMCNYDKDTEE
ncbi:MAG: hypothetical protein ACD_62C00134G0001 [uncultured bacterium]|nr:MAG: hypothetical protein ACD_62C00134G0001 [uncultured bacterium]